MSTGQGDTPIPPEGVEPTDLPAEPANDLDVQGPLNIFPEPGADEVDASAASGDEPAAAVDVDVLLNDDDVDDAAASGDEPAAAVDVDVLLNDEPEPIPPVAGGNGDGGAQPPFDFDEVEPGDDRAPAWFGPSMEWALRPIHERLDNHGGLIAGLRTDLDAHTDRMVNFERDAAEAIARAAVDSGVIEGVVTSVAANVIDERIAPLITANTEAINANTAQVTEVVAQVTALDARVEQVEAAVRPDNLRTTVTEIVDTRIRESVTVGFSWPAFAVVMTIGFVVDVLFFTSWGSYNSKVDPGLAHELGHYMHVQNFFAVLFFSAAVAVVAGILFGSREQNQEERESTRLVFVRRRRQEEPQPEAAPGADPTQQQPVAAGNPQPAADPGAEPTRVATPVATGA